MLNTILCLDYLYYKQDFHLTLHNIFIEHNIITTKNRANAIEVQ